jgi:endoglucanase
MKKLILPTVLLLTVSQVFAQSVNLDDLHSKVIKFYQYQRAGLKDGNANNANSGWSNAAHANDNYNGHQLDGGWYDAGDYVKFGMNGSYSLYCLLKGYDVFPNAYALTGSVPNILEQCKFATDYYCKAVIDENTIVLDVGDANSDHQAGFQPSNNPGRSGSEIKLCNGGDIPATYAACLALMSVLYRKYDDSYADDCLVKAKQAFAFAKKKFAQNQNYCTPQGSFYDYPTVNGDKKQQIGDRKVAAGVELYRATIDEEDQDPTYRKWASSGMSEFYNCMGYSFIGPLSAFEVWRQGLGSSGGLSTNITFIEGRIQTSGVFSNVFRNSDWGTARDVGTVAFEYGLGYVTTDSETKRELYEKRAVDHINWVTGNGTSNNQSFICGVNGGPTSIHYRTSSYGAIPGAVVSGPDDAGNWSNDGQNYQYTEVAVDYNAGIVGGIAFLKALKDNSALGVSKGFDVSSTSADLTAKPLTFSAGLSKSVGWKIRINGAFGSKIISGSSSSINESWDGSADDGFFLAGEIIKAVLTPDEPISALDLVKVKPISIEILTAKKAEAKAGDKLIDNFDDGDSLNEVGSSWICIGNGTGANLDSYSFTDVDGSGTVLLNANVKTFDPADFAAIATSFGSGSLANAKSIIFDMKGNRNFYVAVELMQPTVTDGAFHRVDFPVSDQYNTYRFSLSQFMQPDSKTEDVSLDLSSVTGIRFAVYDSVGRGKVYVDNVSIEGFDSVPISQAMFQRQMFTTPGYMNGTLRFAFPFKGIGPLQLSVFDLNGRTVIQRSFPSNSIATVSTNTLPDGMYTAVYSVGDHKISPLRFIVSR